jgi:hypothetical protein
VEKIPDSEPMTLYAVTDSVFVAFQPILDSCDWQTTYEDSTAFILAVNEKCLSLVFSRELDKIAAEQGVANLQKLKFERIADILWKSKNQYVMRVLFENHKLSTEKLVSKGMEIIKSTTPDFARGVLKGVIGSIFENPHMSASQLIEILRPLKNEMTFSIPDKMDNISFQSKVPDYAKFVEQDENKLVFAPHANHVVKAAAYYNFLLKQNPVFSKKYRLIGTGDKVKYYHCEGEHAYFAYLPGKFPIEFAPVVNVDKQFSACILEPVNSLAQPLGIPALNDKLKVFASMIGKSGEVKKTAHNIFEDIV